MTDLPQETVMFRKTEEDSLSVAATLRHVYIALERRGYNPVDQLTGYLLSGDPTYITSSDDARSKLRQHERYEIIETLLVNYLAQKNVTDQ